MIARSASSLCTLPMSPQTASAYNWALESARYPPITLSDRRHLLLIDISFIKTAPAPAREIK
jgi:hypothetical protein